MKSIGERVAATRRRASGYALVVAAVLVGLTVLLVWNVYHYDPARGFDAKQHFRYVEILRTEQRLPNKQDVLSEWQSPPVFHAVAAALEQAWIALPDRLSGQAHVATQRAHKVVQLFNALAAVGIAAFVLLIARQVFPRSPTVQVTALLLTALAPPLTRAAVMYHGQTLATLLAVAGLYLVVRAVASDAPSARTGLAAGAILGLGIVTRQFVLATVVAALAALAVYWLTTRQPAAIRMALTLVLATIAFSIPWFAHQQVVYGSPLAQGYKAPDKPFFERQPLEFYVELPVRELFTMPYRQSYTNRMLPVVYSDWWGDYWEFFEVPRSAMGARPLPPKYHRDLVIQAYVGVIPTLLALGGLVGLVMAAVRRRSAAIAAVVLSVLLVIPEALYFWIGFPISDGDTMKAIYVLTVLPGLAIAGGWALATVRRRSRAAFGVLAMVLIIAGVLDFQYLWLDGRVAP